MDVWIDMYHGIRRLADQGVLVLLTDDAVGDAEEESLAHLSANLGGGGPLRSVVPFLTCKHPLTYCRHFARRAAALGVAGITVVGGDTSVGPPRCVPHGRDLRRILRQEVPDLPLGGWANPHRDAEEQAAFLHDSDSPADFILTQVVSHHSIRRVEAFRRRIDALGLEVPVVYGVFHYRSGNPRTLEILSRFFPVPRMELEAEFASGDTADQICARTIRALRDVGADRVYVSNLVPREAPRRLAAIRRAVDGG